MTQQKYEYVKDKILDYYNNIFNELSTLLLTSDKTFTEKQVGNKLKLKWYNKLPREKHLISFDYLIPLDYLDNMIYIDVKYFHKIVELYNNKILDFMDEIENWFTIYFPELKRKEFFDKDLKFETYIKYFPACIDLLEKCKIKKTQIDLVYTFDFLKN
jgi:hypothetical protein